MGENNRGERGYFQPEHTDREYISRYVSPDDRFWDAETYEGEKMSARDIDDVLYS